MLTETKAIESNVAIVGAAMPQRASFSRQATGLTAFLAVVVQFGLIVLIVQQWQLESLSLSRVMQLAFVGFIIHHFLPLRF
jgi:cell division septal protein FtsQ